MSKPKKTTEHVPETAKGHVTSNSLPVRVDRKRGALIITDRFFPISHRTLETWPVTWRHVNGRATCDTNELLAVAQAKLEAAPPLRGGKKVPSNNLTTFT
jgi:hypothetical protein